MSMPSVAMNKRQIFRNEKSHLAVGQMAFCVLRSLLFLFQLVFFFSRFFFGGSSLLFQIWMVLGIGRKPSSLHPLMLLEQFDDAPEAGKSDDSDDGG